MPTPRQESLPLIPENPPTFDLGILVFSELGEDRRPHHPSASNLLLTKTGKEEGVLLLTMGMFRVYWSVTA